MIPSKRKQMLGKSRLVAVDGRQYLTCFPLLVCCLLVIGRVRGVDM